MITSSFTKEAEVLRLAELGREYYVARRLNALRGLRWKIFIGASGVYRGRYHFICRVGTFLGAPHIAITAEREFVVLRRLELRRPILFLPPRILNPEFPRRGLRLSRIVPWTSHIANIGLDDLIIKEEA